MRASGSKYTSNRQRTRLTMSDDVIHESTPRSEVRRVPRTPFGFGTSARTQLCPPQSLCRAPRSPGSLLAAHPGARPG